MAGDIVRDIAIALKGILGMPVVVGGTDDSGDFNAAFVDTDGSLKVGFIADVEVTITPPAVVIADRKTVTTAGTAEALGASTALEEGVIIMALKGNTNNVFVGDSSVDKDSAKQYELEPGEAMAIAVDDLAKIYVDVTTNGEGVQFVGS